MAEANHRALRVLIVDRSEAFVAGASSWIEDRPGLTLVGAAGSGPAGLEAAERCAPDLVLVDAVLPELDGFRVVRALKSRPRAPLVVVTTFLASAAAAEAAYAAGADGFIAKDDFAGSFELLLDDLLDGASTRLDRLKTRERSAPRGSRTEPDP